VDGLQHDLAIYGYAAMFPLAVFEGPAVTVIAAFLAAQGLLDVVAVYGVSVLGDLTGDVMYYVLGRWASLGLAGRQGRWAAGLSRRIERLAPRVQARAGAMLLFGKLTHSAGFAVLLAAGAAAVPLQRFLLFNLLGTLPKSLLLVLAGYWFGRLFNDLQGDLRVASLIGFVAAGGALLLMARRLLALPDEREA
jgi:membrane protein DedA with SNARE-associated domain